MHITMYRLANLWFIDFYEQQPNQTESLIYSVVNKASVSVAGIAKLFLLWGVRVCVHAQHQILRLDKRQPCLKGEL